MAENNQRIMNLMSNLRYDATQCMVTNILTQTLKFLTFNRIVVWLWDNTLGSDEYEVDQYSVRNQITNKLSRLNINIHFEIVLIELIELNIELLNRIFRSHFHEYISFQLFAKNVCWTQQGTINISKTMLQIFRNTNLSTAKKFEIACNYFWEDEIRVLFQRLPVNYYETKEYNRLCSRRYLTYTFDLHDFWASYIWTNELPPLINELPACEFLLEFAASHNSISVPYIWEKFADEAVKNKILKFTNSVHVYYDCNILFYFYTRMNETQLRDVKITFYCGVIDQICSLARWNDIVSASKFLLELIQIRNATDSLYIINYSWCVHSDFFSISEYENIWIKFAVQFKHDIKRNIIELVEKTIDSPLSIYKVLKTLSLLLKITTDEDKQKVIYNNNLMEFCKEVVLGVDIDALEEFINIFKGESIIKLKENFFRNKGVDICLIPIINQHFEFVDEILTTFCITDDISKFKINLPYNDNAKILSSLVVFDNNLEKSKNFFEWCFEGSEDETCKCKSVLFDFDSPSYMNLKNNFITRLIYFFELENFELFEKFWNFIFNVTNNKIVTPNEKMRRIKKIILFSETFDLSHVYTSMISNSLFKRFVTTCFNLDESNSLEELKHCEDLLVVVRSFTINLKLKELIKALNWIYSSDASKINKFKEVVIRFCLSSIVFDLVKCNEEKFFISSYVFRKFIPSVKFANMFKEIFEEFINQKDNLAKESGNERELDRWINIKKDCNEIIKSLERYTKSLLKKEKNTENELSKLPNQNRSDSKFSPGVNFPSMSMRSTMYFLTPFLVLAAILVKMKLKGNFIEKM